MEVIGPHIRDYLQRDPRFRDRLRMVILSTIRCISFHVSAVGVGCHDPNRLPQHGLPNASFTVVLCASRPISHHAWERLSLCTDVLALLPRESLVSFETDLAVTEEILVTMPNLEALHLTSPAVSDEFLLPDPDGPNAHKKLLPSLRRLYLKDAKAMDDDWNPLVAYLAYQTSGDQGVHVCLEIIKRM